MKKSFGARTLVFPSLVWCIGTNDAIGKLNAMAFTWGGICCNEYNRID
jgi:hypothetical protein